MKKVLSIFLALVMVVLCFAACGKKDDAKTDEPKSDFLVGAVYINSQNDTAGYTFAHHNGITKAMEQLGLPKENLKIVDNVKEDTEQVSKAIDTLAGLQNHFRYQLRLYRCFCRSGGEARICRYHLLPRNRL